MWSELNRRRVVRTTIAYVVVGLGILQAADLILPGVAAPPWVYRVLVVALLVALPLVIGVAWAFDIRGGRLVRTVKRTHRLPRPSSRGRWVNRGVYAAALVVVVFAAWALLARSPPSTPTLDPDLVAIFPFRVSAADPSLSFLSEGVPELLATALSGKTGPRAADPGAVLAAWRRLRPNDATPAEPALLTAARELGAGRVLLGQIAGTPAQVSIRARMIDARTGNSIDGRAAAVGDDIAGLVDRLAVALLAVEAGETRDRLDLLTSTSLDAVKEYLLGQAAYRRADFRQAGEHFVAALDVDSTFALAGLRMDLTGAWSLSGLTAAQRARGRQRAWAHRDRLSSIDALVLEALAGPDYPAAATESAKCQRWQQARDLAPDRAELWHMSADCFYHFGKAWGVPDHLERAAELFRRSVALDSTFLPNLRHLVELEIRRGDIAETQRNTELYLRVDSAGEASELVRWWAAYARRDSVELALLTRRLDSFSLGILFQIQHLLETMGAERSLADSVVAAYTRQPHAGIDRDRVRVVRLGSALNRGHTAEALSLAKSVSDRRGAVNILTAVMYGEPDAEMVQYADSILSSHTEWLSRVDADPAPAQLGVLCSLEQYRLWRGEKRYALASIRLLERAGKRSDIPPTTAAHARICADLVRAILASVRGDADARELAFNVDSITAEHPRFDGLTNYIHLVAARLLERGGDPAAALRAVNRVAYMLSYEGMLHARLRETGRLAALLGDRDRAMTAYQHYLALRDPDARDTSTTMVRQELARLVAERPGR